MFLIPEDSFEIKETAKKGRGIFATKEIKKDTVIGNYTGEIVRYEEVNEDDYEFLMYLDDEKGIVADKNEVGVHLMNHSCAPNCQMRLEDKVMQFVATCAIQPSEELTICYMYPPQDECDRCTHQCFCGEENCLKTMHTPKEEYERWRKVVGLN